MATLLREASSVSSAARFAGSLPCRRQRAQSYAESCAASGATRSLLHARSCSEGNALRRDQRGQSCAAHSPFLTGAQQSQGGLSQRNRNACDGSHRSRSLRVNASSSTATAATAAAASLALQRPGLIDTAPVKGRLPGGRLPMPGDQGRAWPLLWPSHRPFSSPAEAAEDDPRRSIVRAAPRTPTADLSTAAQMARLSSLVYYPDPSSRLEALGLELKECRQTPHTAFFVADGPADLFGRGQQRGGRRREGKTRYVITRGVAMDREEVDGTDLWLKLLHFWPVEFERGLTPRGSDLLVHGGVQEIAEQTYAALLPFLAFDPKKEGISAVRFGGHSLGGSLAVLLMLMFHLRSPVRRGYSQDLDFNSHTFGSFPVLASPFQMPWGGGSGAGNEQGETAPSNQQCVLMRALEGLKSQLRCPLPLGAGRAGAEQIEEAPCSILSKLGLADAASQAFVHDSDIVPRAFALGLKQDAVRHLLGLRERVAGTPRSSQWHASGMEFQAVGLLNYMHAHGDGVAVARLRASLAGKALHMDLGDFIRNPSLIGKSIQDHYFNNYVTRLESALASARVEALGH